MNKKDNIKIFGVFLLVSILSIGILTTAITLDKKEKLTDKEAQAKWSLFSQIYSPVETCKIIQKENLFNLPQEDRTFPYLKLKEGVNCLNG